MTTRSRTPGIFVTGISPLVNETKGDPANAHVPQYPNAYFVIRNGKYYLDTEADSGIGYHYDTATGRFYLNPDVPAGERVLLKPMPDGLHIVINTPDDYER